ncbi:hypothetical protein DOTSEDRAFT_19237 [Dothistroma septosporum NZE10]|uniref:Uncharacterized protein n=1 Tax=Dothistroma septosporum (strain NZE10 / CBS 128990) TaxID=675120 RepID=N1Q2N0_DOTSN|nr:hypothetical protein DOTSEDRAFT_19237 [Dothistroma septosporum NZE10]
MSYSNGQKVTTAPESYQSPKNENPGTVLSDSLAAESITSGGSLAANSDARGPSSQPSKSTTTNTTDTSNATRLDPAPDAEARQAQEGWDDQNQLNAAGRIGNQQSSGNTYITSGGTLGGSGVSRQTQGEDSAAPNYVENPAPSQGGTLKPKGQNITEGGFDSSAPNASFTTDIGGKNDPGRDALRTFGEKNVPSSGGAGPREYEITNDGQFDTLGETSA